MFILDFTWNNVILVIIIISITLWYPIIRIFYITKEIRETWKLRDVWYLEYFLIHAINADIRDKHESPSKKAD